MKILRIQKSKDRYLIELNEGNSLSLKESVFVRHNLYKGKEVSREMLDFIRADAEKQEAIDFALKKLTNRKSEHEIRMLLQREDFDESTIDSAVEYLYTYHFLDDREYALLYARDKRKLNGYGPIKIAYILRTKGLDETDIRRALEEYTEEEECSRIERLIEKKYLRNGKLIQETPKIIRFLLSRGFHYDKIKSVLKSWT